MKTFSARTMPEALALVRRAFGTDAVILHTRTYRRGGVLGLGAKPVVEITATTGRALAKQKLSGPPRRHVSAPKPAALPKNANPTAVSTPAREPSEPLAGELIKRTYAAARAEMSTARDSSDAVAASVSPNAQTSSNPAPTVALAPPPVPAIDQQRQLTDELAAVKALVARVAEQQEKQVSRQAAPDEVPDHLVEAYTTLIQQEVAEELAREIVAQAADADDPPAAVCEALAALMPEASDGVEPDAPTSILDDRPRTIALVGPTGVGKTTTVAKLAATLKLKQGKAVGVVTLDTYRIAAVDQLKTYCSIIGCPLEVAGRPEELAACLDHLSDCDVVLIDTAGRSQRDDVKLDELAAFLRVARAHETHLVLSSTCSQSVMIEIAERFARVNPDRVIFTKLDEAVTCGTIFNVAARIAKRVSYVTTGQEVPHQIEPGDARMLARRVLGRLGERTEEAERERAAAD